MNKYLSSKIKVVSFISILMVVYVHCYNYKDSCLDITTTIAEGLNYGTFIEYFICNGFTRVCVPLFFIISGYLFFLGCDFSLSKYVYKVKSRFVSLVIPFFIWTSLAILFYLIFRNVEIDPVKYTIDTLNNDGILPLFIYPPCYQMWYVQQLFLYVLAAPIFYFILKNNYLSLIYFIFVFAIWFIDLDCGFLRTEGLLFFAFGSYLALNKKEDIILEEKNNNNMIILFSIWMLLLVVKTVISGLGIDGLAPKAIYRIAELIGIYVVWYGVDYILKNESLKEKLLSLSSYTFFIFCFHEPFLNFVMNYSLTYITNSTLGCLITYFIYTNAGIILAILLGKILRTYANSIYSVLCGGRGSKKKDLEMITYKF